MIDFWYRYYEVWYSPGSDESGDPLPGRGEMKIHLEEWQVVKHTPKGVWLSLYGDRKFVLKSAAKRYACPTKKEALQSLVARKTRQIRILTEQRERASIVKGKAQYMLTQLTESAA